MDLFCPEICIEYLGHHWLFHFPKRYKNEVYINYNYTRQTFWRELNVWLYKNMFTINIFLAQTSKDCTIIVLFVFTMYLELKLKYKNTKV